MVYCDRNTPPMNVSLEFLQPIYSPIYRKYVRHRLPRRRTVLNGVVTKAARLLDPESRSPDHKRQHVGLIKQHVQEGDEVVEVGSGYGVCTIWAARQGASVTGYEGSSEMVEVVRDAVVVNSEIHDIDFSERIDVRHALVGEGIDVWGSTAEAAVVHPSDLPSCDVLILDCEGAETDIVPAVVGNPSRAIVEVHPQFDADTETIRETFASAGYETTVYELDEIDLVYAHND
jgi:hypothetical protein